MINMSETIVKYAEMTPEENEKWQRFYEEIRQHDEATALKEAWREGFIEGFRNSYSKVIGERMRRTGFTEDQIKIALGEDYSEPPIQ